MLNLRDSLETFASGEHSSDDSSCPTFPKGKEGNTLKNLRDLKPWKPKAWSGKSLRKGDGRRLGALRLFHWHLALGHPCWVRRSQGVQVSPELVSD